jgi:hypothetical protein
MLDGPWTLHHMMGRGIEGVKLVSNRENRGDFLEYLAGFE